MALAHSRWRYVSLNFPIINMKRKIKSVVFAVIAAVLIIACKEENADQEFWLGADLGWITEYESLGYKFYNNDGQVMECTALMKELGLNAVRHRIWVDPSKQNIPESWSGHSYEQMREDLWNHTVDVLNYLSVVM